MLKTLRIVLLFGIWPVFFFAKASLAERLLILTNEGSESSKTRLTALKNYLGEKGCFLEQIETANQLPEPLLHSLVFFPLKPKAHPGYSPLAKLAVLNNQSLSTSILVRESTGVENLAQLADMHLGFLTKDSVLGYELPKHMLQKAGVELKNDNKIVLSETNASAMVLLLHGDVFASVLATPLVDKWATVNGLKAIAQSEALEPGGVYIFSSENQQFRQACSNAFQNLNPNNPQHRSLFKLFPAWVDGFQ